ncbi:CsMn84 [Gelatoporia subvermispora B]|uniref:CsMn84 n=1 Tax=Ceriporiopsis subvermispora (strain B) TaxID=914234 RepID=M2QB11_CERS8|nr:CsMn84 [Gelatoporia subvermispora B]
MSGESSPVNAERDLDAVFAESRSKGRILNSRRADILRQIDNATFSSFHVRITLVSGVGFFTDAYDLFAINITSVILGLLYGTGVSDSKGRHLSTDQELKVKIATPVGIVVGQLLFGWLGDVLGRKRIYGLELTIIMIATFGQATCAQGGAINIISMLTVWRLLLGVGIGGDYPLSAVISSEFSSVYIRGRVMTATFANQGWGQLAATITATVVVKVYKSSIEANDIVRIDQAWRLIFGIGMIPAVIALYFRLTIPETPRFTLDIEHNVEQAAMDVDSYLSPGLYTVDPNAPALRIQARQRSTPDFIGHFSQWKNLKDLIGTAYSWFVLDIAFYGLGLNSSIILSALDVPRQSSGNRIYDNLLQICLGNLIISIAGYIPGYWATFFLIDKWGRRPIQLMGFAILTILFIIMGGAFTTLNSGKGGQKVSVFLLCLVNFFQNFGPNTTTFIIPGEVFPTRYRSTAHGISAACGKLGAILAQLALEGINPDLDSQNRWIGYVLIIFGALMATGIASTCLIPETKQKTLEYLSNEHSFEFSEAHVSLVPRPRYV